MKEYTRNVLIGIFVLAALACLGLMLVWFGESPAWLSSNEWQLKIGPVHGLRGISQGTTVQLNGVEIGRVATVDLRNPERPERGVTVTSLIKRQYTIPQGSYAKLYGAAFGFGAGRVDIIVQPDTHMPPEPTDGTAEIMGEASNVLSEIVTEELRDSINRMIDNIGNLAHDATPVAQDLHNMLQERSVEQVDAEGMVANLATAVQRFDHLLGNLNTVLGDTEVQGDVRQVAADLAEASAEIKDLVGLWKQETERTSDNVNDGIDRLEGRVDLALNKLITVIDNLDESTRQLNNIMGAVTSESGTVGRLVHDPRLYEAGVVSLERLSELIGTLQRVFGKIEQDGYIRVGQATPVGTFTKKIPVNPPGSGGSGK